MFKSIEINLLLLATLFLKAGQLINEFLKAFVGISGAAVSVRGSLDAVKDKFE